MAYIRVVPESEATGEVAELYRRLAYPDGSVAEAFKVLSLHPALLAADATMYLETLYGDSPLSRADRELLAVTVSRLNGCRSCVRHHSEKLRALLPGSDQDRLAALVQGDVRSLPEREQAMLAFAERLTHEPGKAGESDIGQLRKAGFDDRAILDVCNVVAYFNYANRMTQSLGPDGVVDLPASGSAR